MNWLNKGMELIMAPPMGMNVSEQWCKYVSTSCGFYVFSVGARHGKLSGEITFQKEPQNPFISMLNLSTPHCYPVYLPGMCGYYKNSFQLNWRYFLLACPFKFYTKDHMQFENKALLESGLIGRAKSIQGWNLQCNRFNVMDPFDGSNMRRHCCRMDKKIIFHAFV